MLYMYYILTLKMLLYIYIYNIYMRDKIMHTNTIYLSIILKYPY